MKKIAALVIGLLLLHGFSFGMENEVMQKPIAEVFIREHPQTGKPFVSIRSENNPTDPFKGFVKREVRPDYKMLDAYAKGIPYDGPISDRTKVYVFAATIATLGVAGSVVAAAALPAAASTGATGGAGFYGATGVAIAVGTAGTVAYEMHVKPGDEHYTHTAVSTSTTGVPKQLTFQEILSEIDQRPQGKA